MYNDGLVSMPTPGMLSINKVSDEDTFFQDVRELESLVKNSLLVYVAYELKAEDAASYLADNTGSFPLLEKEAKLRKVSIKQLAELVIGKAKLFKEAVRKAELIRIEFNEVYHTLSTYQEKLELRDRLLKEFKDLTAHFES